MDGRFGFTVTRVLFTEMSYLLLMKRTSGLHCAIADSSLLPRSPWVSAEVVAWWLRNLYVSMESRPGALPLRKACKASNDSCSVKRGALSVLMSAIEALVRLIFWSAVSFTWSSLMTSESSMMLVDSVQLMACWLLVLTAVTACVIVSFLVHNLCMYPQGLRWDSLAT